MSPVTADESQKPIRRRFLDLPYEIRHEIYYNCIPCREQIYVTWVGGPPKAYYWFGMGICSFQKTPVYSPVKVLQLSKQISEECLDILYGENIFSMELNGNGELDLRKNFTKENRYRVRRLAIGIRHVGDSYGTSMPDESLWARVLPNLSFLWILADQPVEVRGYVISPTPKEDLERWMKWVRPYLQCLGKYIPDRLITIIDDDGQKVTREMIRMYMPPSCRLEHFHWGDVEFRRTAVVPAIWV